MRISRCRVSTADWAAQPSASGTSRCPRPWLRSPASASSRSTSAHCRGSATMLYVLDMAAVEDVARTVIASGLQVRSINCDIGDLNVFLADGPRAAAKATSTCSSRLPSQPMPARWCCLRHGHTPVETLETDVARIADELASAATVAASRGVHRRTESLHLHRLCWNPRTRAAAHRSPARQRRNRHGLQPRRRLRRRPDRIRSALGKRIEHVHIRDAAQATSSSRSVAHRRLRKRTQSTGGRRLPLLFARTRNARHHP